MSYEGHIEYKCACGNSDAADAYDDQPIKCQCGQPFVALRHVDCTNGEEDRGDWQAMIKPAPEIAVVPESFCDSVLGAKKDVKTAIADEAVAIVNGARRSAYGRPEDNFERIARFWDAYFKNTGRDIDVTAADVSPMMRLMKEARLCETPDHRDSFVDIIGYAMCGYELQYGMTKDAA